MKLAIRAFAITLIAEIAASSWQWLYAPTDSLRALYGGSFVAYERQRFVAWLIAFAIVAGTWISINARRRKNRARSEEKYE